MTSQVAEPRTVSHFHLLSTKVLFSSHWQTVHLKALCFSTLDVGLEKKETAFYIKALENVSHTSYQQNTKVSSCQMSPSPLCLNFLLTFLLKSRVPFALRKNESYLSWQQYANICCITVPKQSKKTNSPFLNFISNGSKHFIRTSEAIQRRKEKSS